MPAVSVCDPVAAALRYSLANGQSDSTNELSTNLAGNATRILRTDVEYEEASGYGSTVLDQLKAKYVVLGSTRTDKSDSAKRKDGAASSKKNEDKKMGPSLPEPVVTLYSAQKVNLGWKGTLPVGAGMYNVGNTCYLNSTLQALFHVPALVNWLLSDQHHISKCEQNNGTGECLTCAMAKTLQFSHEKSGGAIKPFYIYNKLKLICRTMVPGQQEDAHEFLRYLLEGMERAFLSRHKASKLDSYSKETTPVNQIFGGYIRTEVKCLQCRHVSTTFQHFQDLLVDIRKASTLDEALSGYFSREQLDNNDYKCEACKRRVPATKQFSLERPPKVLCVQLKRFSVLGGKISRHIGFKQTVDMGPYLWREPGETSVHLPYKLTSMVTHMGPSVNCGHYTAVAQVSTGQYYSFDDSCVRPVSLSHVLSTNAYIMIFEMESRSENKSHVHPSIKINGTVTTKNVQSLQNGSLSSNKSMNSKPSVSGAISANGSTTNAFSRARETTEKESCPISTQRMIGPQLPTSRCTNFIGPQLPQKFSDKSAPRMIVHAKNGKVVNGNNSLVPYDGSSDEELDSGSNSLSSKNSSLSSNLLSKLVSHTNFSSSSSSSSSSTSNGLVHRKQQSPLSKDIAVASTATATATTTTTTTTTTTASTTITIPTTSSYTASQSKFVGNFKETSKLVRANENGVGDTHSRTTLGQNGASQNGKSENGTSNNGIGNSSSNKSGESISKVDTNGSRDKWHSPIRVKIDQEDRVPTKATASSIKGWQVSKDTPSPTAATTPNGWSVTDNKEEVESTNNVGGSNNAAATPSAAAPRNFNGTNRSDAVSNLLKMSHRGYGSSTVSSWNGGRARLDREVDLERRDERKRHLDDEDEEEMDRGRVKKIKARREYKERANPGYNPFQEYQSNKSWNRSSGSYHRRAYYNTSGGRPRHGTSYRPPHYRYHNHPRDHWQRR